MAIEQRRSLEKVIGLLNQGKNAAGEPLLVANAILEEGGNLGFASEFGKSVARMDLLAQLLDERCGGIGVNYARSLPFIDLLPVQ